MARQKGENKMNKIAKKIREININTENEIYESLKICKKNIEKKEKQGKRLFQALQSNLNKKNYKKFNEQILNRIKNSKTIKIIKKIETIKYEKRSKKGYIFKYLLHTPIGYFELNLPSNRNVSIFNSHITSTCNDNNKSYKNSIEIQKNAMEKIKKILPKKNTIFSLLYQTWLVNEGTIKGCGQTPITQELYEIKNENLKKIIELIKNKKLIGGKISDILYIEWKQKQISFHLKNINTTEIPEYNNKWVGRRFDIFPFFSKFSKV